MKKTKKAIAFILTAVMLLSTCFTMGVTATEAAKEIIVKVNGTKVSFPDTKPLGDENNRILVPVRFVSEALGAMVKWKSETKSVEITKGNDKVIIYYNKKDYTVNDVKKTMDTVATEKNGRILVPIRFVSEALGATVTWDGNTSTVNITLKPPATEKVGSFIVPTNTRLLVDDAGGDPDYDAWFLINYGFSDERVAQMIEDLKNILLQRLGEDTVNTIINHCKKKELDVFLEGIYLYDKKSNRYITIADSYGNDLNIIVYSFGK